jgi:hypothetical protein
MDTSGMVKLLESQLVTAMKLQQILGASGCAMTNDRSLRFA